MLFFHEYLMNEERDQQFIKRHRVPLVKAHQNMYVLTPKGQGQYLTSGHVTSKVNLGQNRSKDTSFDASWRAEHNEIIAKLYLFSLSY